MAFEGISGGLQNIFKKLTGRGRLSEKDVKDAMREIRLVLLEADVNYLVVKDFVKKVTERAVGADVLESLTPGQQIIKIVNEEMTALMGATNAKLDFGSTKPAIILMAGLQGAGKTTMCGKLAMLLKKQYGKNPLLCACDVYRPAAIEQLKVVGSQLGIPVYDEGQGDPVTIAKNAYAHAKVHGNDLLILDTAGRLHIDQALMDELKRIKAEVKPHEIMLVVDSMVGQDAVNVATTFDSELGIDSVLMSKLDGDARGGAALSVKAVTGKPIKFCGVGEKLDALEPFYPDRMASRILGMGDVMSLIEKAQQTFDEKQAEELEKKMRAGKMTLTDFLDQLRQMKNMGSMEDIMKMMPGMGNKGIKVDEKALTRTEAIILSMTEKERKNPDVINFSRKKRIAAGCGLKVEDVNRLLKQFELMQKLMKQMNSPQMRRMAKRGGFKLPF